LKLLRAFIDRSIAGGAAFRGREGKSNKAWEAPMPLYAMRWMFKDTTVKAMADKPQDRDPPARELIESFGGKMHHYYFMLGEYDGLAIVEFPDNTSAVATSMRASASGAFTRFETHPLMTAQEAQRAMQMVKDCTKAYRAPNA
jgi:uncharacterized protein with GYD domain